MRIPHSLPSDRFVLSHLGSQLFEAAMRTTVDSPQLVLSSPLLTFQLTSVGMDA